MKKQNLLLAMLVFALAFVFQFGLANQKASAATEYDLNAANTVKATVNEVEGKKVIDITGNAAIETAKWKAAWTTEGLANTVGFIKSKTSNVVINVKKDVKLPDDASYMFFNFAGNVNFEEGFSVANVKNLKAFFGNYVPSGIEKWDVSNVTDMSSTFAGTYNSKLDLSKWNVKNVTDMSGMFEHSNVSDLNIANWDVSGVKNMSRMFANAAYVNPDLSKWKTDSLEDASGMFASAYSANPDVSKWNMSKATDVGSMFALAVSAKPSVTNWDVSNVVNMNSMFLGAVSAQPFVSKWNVKKVDNMKGMFEGAVSMRYLDMSKWETPALEQAALGINTLNLSKFKMSRMPGSDNPDATKAGVNVETFKAPSFAGNYVVESIGPDGKVLKTDKMAYCSIFPYEKDKAYAAYLNVEKKMKGTYVVDRYYIRKLKLPKGFPTANLKWVSSSQKVVKTYSDGTIKGMYPGKATITAQDKYNPYVKCSYTVVTKPSKPSVRYNRRRNTVTFKLYKSKGSDGIFIYRSTGGKYKYYTRTTAKKKKYVIRYRKMGYYFKSYKYVSGKRYPGKRSKIYTFYRR